MPLFFISFSCFPFFSILSHHSLFNLLIIRPLPYLLPLLPLFSTRLSLIFTSFIFHPSFHLLSFSFPSPLLPLSFASLFHAIVLRFFRILSIPTPSPVFFISLPNLSIFHIPVFFFLSYPPRFLTLFIPSLLFCLLSLSSIPQPSPSSPFPFLPISFPFSSLLHHPIPLILLSLSSPYSSHFFPFLIPFFLSIPSFFHILINSTFLSLLSVYASLPFSSLFHFSLIHPLYRLFPIYICPYFLSLFP